MGELEVEAVSRMTWCFLWQSEYDPMPRKWPSLRPQRERETGMITANKESEIREALALQAKDLVSYQEGSIVSRTLLKRQTGNVTLFALDNAQGLSEHTSPFDALVQVLEGEMEISIDGKPLKTAPGDIVLMPANRPHALKALTKVKMLLTMIRA